MSGNFQSRPPMPNLGDTCSEKFEMNHKYGHNLLSMN